MNQKKSHSYTITSTISDGSAHSSHDSNDRPITGMLTKPY